MVVVRPGTRSTGEHQPVTEAGPGEFEPGVLRRAVAAVPADHRLGAAVLVAP